MRQAIKALAALITDISYTGTAGFDDNISIERVEIP
jgi:hypothetical protein